MMLMSVSIFQPGNILSSPTPKLTWKRSPLGGGIIPRFPKERASQGRCVSTVMCAPHTPRQRGCKVASGALRALRAQHPLLCVCPRWGSARAAALRSKRSPGLVQVLGFHSVALAFQSSLTEQEFQGSKCQVSLCGCPVFGTQRAPLSAGISPAACIRVLQSLHASAKAECGQKRP